MNQPTYKGEAMLLRWSENSANGRTVTFTIEDGPDSSKEHPFKGLHCGKGGQRFAIVAVPLGESEHPNFSSEPEPKQEPVFNGKRVTQVAMLCKDMLFGQWVREHVNFDRYDDTEQNSRQYILENCKIESRRELAMDDDAWVRAMGIMDSFNRWSGRAAEMRG